MPVRRRWAALGMSAKVLTVVVGLVVGFLVLGGLLEACGGGSPEPGGQAPSSSAVESSPTVEGSPSAAEPEREDPNRPVVTFTETVTASEPVESATSASGEPESSSSAEGVYYRTVMPRARLVRRLCTGVSRGTGMGWIGTGTGSRASPTPGDSRGRLLLQPHLW